MISGLRDGWSLAWALAERFGRAGVRLREGLIRRLAPAHPFGASPLCGDVLRRPLAGLSNRRFLIKSSLSAIHKKARRWPGFFVYGGEGGIRTLDTRNAYGSLAGNWFQPLTHLSGTLFFQSFGNDLAAHDTSLREKYSPKIRHSRRCRCFFRVESAGRSLRGAPRLPSGR